MVAAPVKVEARRLARALRHARWLTLDYAAQNGLMLRGDDQFIFGVAGR
jgi:hypothetical protein